MSRFDPHTRVSASEGGTAQRQRLLRTCSLSTAAVCTRHGATPNARNAAANTALMRNAAATQRPPHATALRIGQSRPPWRARRRERSYSLWTMTRAPINNRHADSVAATRPFAA